MISRRAFFGTLAAPLLAQQQERIIDVHQHLGFGGRSDDDLITHQREMGVTQTMLLPWISNSQFPDGRSKYALPAQPGGNDSAVALSREYPKQYMFFCNEVSDVPDARVVLEKYLKLGARGIGEQKFHVEVDSKYMDLVASVAEEYQVPVTMHFQHEAFNLGIENMHKLLERHPHTNFIGHAQTFWGNIDKNFRQDDSYPSGKVSAGGISDRLLSDYPNMYADMSAKSGLNGMLRDEDHAREFLKRHQDKLMFGSDCPCRNARGPDCLGAQILAAVRRLAPTQTVTRKILCDNAVKLMKIPA
jgi:predicted TIM-barrel fold metal-dependent hydrolase